MVQRVFEVIESPRVHEVLRGQRALDALVVGLSVPAFFRSAIRDSGKRLARTMGLATEEDLRRLEMDIVQRMEGGASSRSGSRTVRFRRHGETN